MATGRIPIKKVYMDSRLKIKDSDSNSQLKYELKESIQSPDKCCCFIDDVIVPVSWFNVDENSKYIYVRRYQDLTDTTTDRVVPIEINNHSADTLTDAIQEGLNTVCGAGVFTVSFDPRKLKISILAESQNEIKVFTDDEPKGANDWSVPLIIQAI